MSGDHWYFIQRTRQAEWEARMDKRISIGSPGFPAYVEIDDDTHPFVANGCVRARLVLETPDQASHYIRFFISEHELPSPFPVEKFDTVELLVNLVKRDYEMLSDYIKTCNQAALLPDGD